MPVITSLTNLILKTSSFSGSQELARVRAVNVKGENSDPNNYKPTSILTSLSKITEKYSSLN